MFCVSDVSKLEVIPDSHNWGALGSVMIMDGFSKSLCNTAFEMVPWSAVLIPEACREEHTELGQDRETARDPHVNLLAS